MEAKKQPGRAFYKVFTRQSLEILYPLGTIMSQTRQRPFRQGETGPVWRGKQAAARRDQGKKRKIYGLCYKAVVDLLYTGIIQSDYERFSRNLDKSGAVIADRTYPVKP